MKILIIGFAKIKYMPYLNLYLDNIDASKNEVHVLYWNRDSSADKPLPEGVTQHIFNEHMPDEIPKSAKIGGFLKFRKFAKSVIKKENFDFIVVLTSIPAVLLCDVLVKAYRGRYIYDYRDYTLEKLPPYKKCVEALCKNALFTIYSSEKHRQFLPEVDNIFRVHNFLKASLSHRGEKSKTPSENSPIRLSYWGIIRNESFNLKVIKALANDSRFEITFHGRKQQTAEVLENYCKLNGVKNVRFTGEYTEEDRYTFANNTDLLYNLYDTVGTEGMAMGNKFYDGIIFYLPQICTKGSYMGDMVEEYRIGKAVDPESEGFADSIADYCRGLDMLQFRKNCDDVIRQVIADNDLAAEKIRSALG